ncbi:hypothetical protein E0Z10_g4735 [Xylaria hypoxylon]|uniref:FAD-binding FR-type domain-containing protein n=1 Tax=Xylaria hypoxylon TaxID=37992 RepID=A0A4Z0YX69_9PEZI|nr:hypothetical protein E0Z10_g4735 [Xylaria hypoxylon]
MSTYGEGEPSDNDLEFVAWAQRDGRGTLENLRYAAFGCGNHNYKHDNKTIDDVVNGLSDRGATAVMSVGNGDESTRTTNENFLEWKNRVFAVLVSEFNLTEYDVGYEPGVEVVEENSKIVDKSPKAHTPFVRGTPKYGLFKIVSVLVATQRVIASYKEVDRTCVHLELDLAAHREIKYKTGDHICIWPINPGDEILDLLKLPSPTTPHTRFQHYLESCAHVRRESVLFLADFEPTERAKAELKMLAETKETYARFLDLNHVTLSRLLKYITDVDPSATWEELPLSPAVSPRRVSVTVSTNPMRLAATPAVVIPGFASTFLSSPRIPGTEVDMKEGQILAGPRAVYVQVRTSTFRLPVSLSVPVIMVAAGIGIAPFRAFLQERAHLASSELRNGHRPHEVQSGPLAGKLHVFTAFSRAEGGEKKYVGDQLAAQGQEVTAC